MSRRRGLSFVLVAVVLAGCAASKAGEVERLRARAAHERGLTALADRQRGEALVALQEAVALDPGDARYHDSLGLLLLDLGQVDQAMEQFKKALDVDPQLADSHLQSYRAALALPTLTVPDFTHQNLGLALYHLKRFGEAEQSLRFALSLDPEMQAAYYNLGLVLVAEDRKEEAKAAFRQARKLGPESTLGQAARERLRALGDEG